MPSPRAIKWGLSMEVCNVLSQAALTAPRASCLVVPTPVVKLSRISPSETEMNKRGWVLWCAWQRLFAFGFPASWSYILKDCSPQGQSLGAHFCSGSWRLSMSSWPQELEQLAVKSHYENWWLHLYWLDTGINWLSQLNLPSFRHKWKEMLLYAPVLVPQWQPGL